MRIDTKNIRKNHRRGRGLLDREAICPVCGTLLTGAPICPDLKHAVPAAGEPCWFLQKVLQGCREELALERARPHADLCQHRAQNPHPILRPK